MMENEITNAIEELSEYKYLVIYTEKILEEYNRFQDLATKTTSQLSSEPRAKGQVNSKVEKYSIAMADLAKEQQGRLKNAEIKINNILAKIDKVEEPFRTILYLKYVNSMKIEEIAEKLHTSESYMSTQHRKAIEKYLNS